jgi:hypothetical protein
VVQEVILLVKMLVVAAPVAIKTLEVTTVRLLAAPTLFQTLIM